MTPRPLLAGTFLLAALPVQAQEMRMAVTTSFENSGLADVLLPAIAEDTGIEVQLLVVGTGQAIRLGEAGDVDAILVHAQAAEEEFVSAGFGTARQPIMYNDFVIVGPSEDPAGLADLSSAVAAVTAVEMTEAPFVSRGDDSGTHKAELALWSEALLDPETFGPWYNAVGAGMGSALNTAAGLNAYILADRASWLNFGNKGDLAVLFEGDPALYNQYTYIPVNPERHPNVQADLAMELQDWLTSPAAQELIDNYTIAGEALFVFNADDPEAASPTPPAPAPIE
ncbi:sulfate ABC transporter substrate-binding protein [Salipiger sp. IMCC34102]|uniref:substrate-binding domain-containing protein n=1 Tax=Salipiger sp. IMCC34102 TaxID=2510647 RepID=UPI00101C22A1|nr:substrate-binding domain-containing protein [Salipiger sp. IMCC34102]RYH03476.1 sulfate ABC transporter substrate-binding protein [Salipiger sp. IMCC34102]